MFERQTLQRIKAVMMPDIQLMIQQSIREAKLEILTHDRNSLSRQFENQFTRLATDKIQVESIRRDIVNIKSKLQISQNTQRQLRDIRQDIRLLNRNIDLKTKISNTDNPFNPFKQVNLSFKQNIQSSKIRQLINKFEQIQKKVKNLMEDFDKKKKQLEFGSCPIGIIDPKTANIGCYKICGRAIKKIIDDEPESSQLLGSVSIVNKKLNTFVVYKKTGDIDIGIIDSRWINDRNSDQQRRKQVIVYHGWGSVWESGKYKLGGLPQIKNGSTISMSVDNEKITWNVDGISFFVDSPLINQKWVPFLSMRNSGDIINWH